MSTTNPYDDLLDAADHQDAVQPAPKAANPYEELVAQDEQALKSQTSAVLHSAVKVNPDHAAQAADVAEKQGLPQDVALRNLPEALARQRMADAEHTIERSPVLAERMRYAPFAQMAHDSVDSLAGIEKVFREGAFAARALGSGAVSGYGGLVGLAEGYAQLALDVSANVSAGMRDIAAHLSAAVRGPYALASAGAPETPVTGPPEATFVTPLTTHRKGVERQSEAIAPALPADASMLRRGVFSGIQSVGQQAPALAASILTGNPGISIAYAGATTAGQSTAKALDAGKSGMQALGYGGIDGGIEIATELVPAARLLGDLKAGSSIWKTVAHQFIPEVVGEQLATLGQDANEWLTLHPDKSFKDFAAERPAAAMQTLIATLVGTGVQTGASHALAKAAGVMEKRATEKAFTEQDMQTLERLLKIAETDKLRERSPQQFAQTVQAMADASQGAPKQVYLDANTLVETLHQHGMTHDQIEQAFPSVAPQLADAVVSGGDVVVPIGEFVALTAGHEAQAALLDHARLSEDTLSRAEQKALGETKLAADAETLDPKEVAQQSAQAVRGVLLEQLNAVGRFSPAVNAAYADTAAAMYETTAARLGITAEELFKQHPIDVTGESIGLQRLSQRSLPEGLTIKEREDGTGFEAVNAEGKVVGYLRDNLKRGQAQQIDENANIDIVRVDQSVRGRGVGAALYQAFNEKHGGRIAPSGKTTQDAWRVWKRDFPEKVAQFVEQEAQRLRSGAASELVLGNITDPEVRSRVAAASQSLAQGGKAAPNATYTPASNTLALLAKANLSSFHHELGHAYLEMLTDLAAQPNAPAAIVEDMQRTLEWFGITGSETVQPGEKSGTLNQSGDQTQTEAFKTWFGDSKVVDKDGKPLVVYHGRSGDFTAFKVEGRGKTAGTGAFFSSSAAVAATYTGGSGNAANTVPVYLRLKNPLLVAANGQNWNALGKGTALDMPAVERRDDTEELAAALEDRKADPNTTVRTKAKKTTLGRLFTREFLHSDGFSTDEMAAWARTQGFDGVIFRGVRDRGPTGEMHTADAVLPADLYVAFEPAQIKSAIGNRGTFDSNEPNILNQDGTAPEPTGDLPPGRTPMDVWRAMSFEQKEPYHEKFARGFEAFLFEGKAPSRELSGVFSRFAEWMRRIYRSIKALNVEINDDIRRVYDRMLASEDAIAEMQQLRGMNVAEDADPAVKTLDSEATADAINDLQRRSLRDMQWLTNAKNRALKALQQKAAATRKAVEAQVREEVERMPVYAAENFLRRGKLNIENPTNAQRRLMDETAGANTKLDLATLKEMYGDTPAAPWRYLATGKHGLATAKDGIHPDLAAEIFGFASGDALVRALLAAEPQASVIEGMTDQRMLEQHGELSSPEALQRAAEAAVHNTARAKFIATELNAISKALGSVRVLMAAAKQYAESVIGNKAITQIRPKAYTAAESRYARLALKAMGKSVPDAVNAKRNQLLNHYLAREALDAQDDIRRIREFFDRVANTPDDRAGKSRDMDVVNAARAVLAAYGVGRRGEAASEYLKRVQAYDPALSETLRGAVDAALANAKPIDTLTLNELKALNDEVASLWHLAKRSHQVEIDGQLVAREQVQDALKGRMQEIGIPDAAPGDASAITPGERRVALMRTFRAAMRRVESWVDAMDGPHQLGVFRRYVWQPVKDAADNYRLDKGKYLKRYRDLLDNIAPDLRRRLIVAPELGYTFGKDQGSALSEILHALLHTGNTSNKRKLLLGRKWATENEDGTLNTAKWDSFVKRLQDEGVLTKAHYDFVQGVWNMLEEMKPLAQKTHRDVFGKYFAEVTAEPIKTPFGEYAGGYVPALADSRIVPDADVRKLAEEENASLQFAFPATARGFTKGRVEYNRPLLLDLGSIAQHIDKVLLFGHLERPVRDVRRVLSAPGVAYGLGRIDPQAFGGVLTPWLNRAARQQVETPVAGAPGLMRFFSVLRARAGMTAMFANVVNTAQQITGFSLAAVKVPPRYMLSGMADYLAAPRQTAAAIAEASPYMATRLYNEAVDMNGAIRDVLVNPGPLDTAQAFAHKHAYFLQQAIDNVMGPIIWSASYKQAQDTLPPVDGTGMSAEQLQDAVKARDRDAVRLADAAVRQTQGSNLPEDISRIETGNAFVRMFTQFAGYFNMQANLLGTEFGKLTADMGLRKSAARGLYVLTMGFLVPAWVSELIVQAFRSGPDDADKDGQYLDDWLVAVFGLSTIRGATAMLPGVGPIINAAVNMANAKPYDDRISTAPAIGMLESAARGAVQAAPKLFSDDEVKARDIRDLATLLSMTVGLPVSVAARPLAYQSAIDQGKANPSGPVDAARGYLTGSPGPR